MPTSYIYKGNELDVFGSATCWKEYWSGMVAPYIGRRVLDVGAGTGATIKVLQSDLHERWVALEPDSDLAERIRHDQVAGLISKRVEVEVGCLGQYRSAEYFDTVLYIDVLEHIEDDRGELERAASHLGTRGHLIVLAPAHQALFTPFDSAIGHFRRYSRRSLLDLKPIGLKPRTALYLDAIGLLASLGNKLVLRSSVPTAGQIRIWDQFMVPLSRLIDPITRYTLGKSVLVVWQKE